jgi:hypothetical protein
MDTVPFDADAAGMIPVAEARARLAAAEPLAAATFWTRDAGLDALYGKGWDEAEADAPAPAWLTVPGHGTFQLTRLAAGELASTARAPKKYQEFLSPALLTAAVNYALRERLRECELKLLLAGTGEGPDGQPCPLAYGQALATVVPFSNVKLLDIALLAVRAKFGVAAADGACVDYKLFCDPEHTSFRVVVPATARDVNGDPWCYGLEVSNSLVGKTQTVISGYLFALDTTGGITDVEHSAGGFGRRGSKPDDVYAWAAAASAQCLDGAESACDGLRALRRRDVTDEYEQVLGQLFRDAPVAKVLQLAVLADVEERPGGITMYDLACAASGAANLDGRSWRDVRSLHDLAGEILHQGGGMCDGSLPRGCRRLLAKDQEPGAAAGS